jgi:hypothetical protein
MAFMRDRDDGINESAPSSSSPSHVEIPVPDQLRHFSRSPHPYHRKSSRLLEPGEFRPAENGVLYNQMPIWMRTPPRTSSDSGTEADDESTGLLKGLPAPPLRPRKGLRPTVGRVPEEESTLRLANTLPWSLFVRSPSRTSIGSSGEESYRDSALRRQATDRKRRNEVLRRLIETGLLFSVAVVVSLQENVRLLALSWHRGMISDMRAVREGS